MLKRTVTCGELRKNDAGKEVILNGWVNKKRNLGGLTFIDLRDRYGITQLVFDPAVDKDLLERSQYLGHEDVVGVRGKVRVRPDDARNPDKETGDIEILARELEVLNTAETLPFMVTDRSTALEELRLKHRYLDLRTEELQETIKIRFEAAKKVREYLEKYDFYEIETPFLIKSTPEGARDYVVPSRLHKGKFYALPQSPQTYKQLLMISGFDKYYQIVKCFRDEDLRADRQPEFTQIDLEMSFVEEQDVMDITENMLRKIFSEVVDVKLPEKFLTMSYDEALRKYGSDKPDLRFGNQIHTLNDIVIKSDFRVFTSVVEDKGTVAGICVPKADQFSRKVIDELTDKTKDWGAKGLAYTKVGDEKLESGIAKFMQPIADGLINEFEAKPGDILFFIADETRKTYPILGHLRNELANRLDLREDGYKPVWITEFPLLEWDEGQDRYVATHHPFTAVIEDDIEKLENTPEKVQARAYD
ncbi:MAG: aspartate--tRNA ligase, partial [Candidatus Marinimicrobia bacterium]|nr:aspartate--tRNA ligase [Candidatus Neomarinimicrobiota bacterium]